VLAADAVRVAKLRGSSSRFRGVIWHAGARKWQAKIKDRHLGLFHDEVAAAITYDNAAEAAGRGRPNEQRGLLDGYLDDEVAS
jgi:hypothetical protein